MIDEKLYKFLSCLSVHPQYFNLFYPAWPLNTGKHMSAQLALWLLMPCALVLKHQAISIHNDD